MDVSEGSRLRWTTAWMPVWTNNSMLKVKVLVSRRDAMDWKLDFLEKRDVPNLQRSAQSKSHTQSAVQEVWKTTPSQLRLQSDPALAFCLLPVRRLSRNEKCW